ncbi:iron-containing alcohol dehydrogenase [Candidatus Woesearchaeota archaeon]|nr:iron-containing alcohol dehydrogenase [Candidatus Woesearchaeota archaeon]
MIEMDQKEYSGFGSIERLKGILEGISPKKIFLVTGKRSYELSGAKEAMDTILQGYETSRFSDLHENPKIEDVEKGIEEFRKQDPDVVIAIGGGSAIDTAKLINLFAAQSCDARQCFSDMQMISSRPKPLIAIPTTSGSGSEATHFAVVYADGQKKSVAHEHVLPDAAIVDPALTMSLPKSITASTGIDALSQAIESYWCINSTEDSKELSRKSIRLIMDNLKSAVNNPSRESRAAMAEASNLAGKAINITKTTAPHAISYSFTTYYNIPHGHAVGLTLGKILEFNAGVTEEDCNDPRGAGHVRKSIEEICSILGAESPQSARELIESLMRSIGLETDLNKLEIVDVNVIVDNVNAERLGNNPRKLTKEDLRKMLNQ